MLGFCYGISKFYDSIARFSVTGRSLVPNLINQPVSITGEQIHLLRREHCIYIYTGEMHFVLPDVPVFFLFCYGIEKFFEMELEWVVLAEVFFYFVGNMKIWNF